MSPVMMRIETKSMVISLRCVTFLHHTLGRILDRNRPVFAVVSSMARPTAQVLTLLELLQSGGTRTMTELAGRLGVDERTVRRYVDHLIDLDVPVESVRGRYGGDRPGAGYRIP